MYRSPVTGKCYRRVTVLGHKIVAGTSHKKWRIETFVAVRSHKIWRKVRIVAVRCHK